VTLFLLVAGMVALAGRRDPELASRALQAALVGQTIARLIVLLLSVPLIGVLGMASQIDRTAAIAALAGIAGSAIGSAVGARLPAPPAK
jgi:ABC-type proline/glycine betaine transport system permease subunit